MKLIGFMYGQVSSIDFVVFFFQLQTVHHGFPNKPTALAWDPELRLLAIATASGALKVYPFFKFTSIYDIFLAI